MKRERDEGNHSISEGCTRRRRSSHSRFLTRPRRCSSNTHGQPRLEGPRRSSSNFHAHLDAAVFLPSTHKATQNAVASKKRRRIQQRRALRTQHTRARIKSGAVYQQPSAIGRSRRRASHVSANQGTPAAKEDVVHTRWWAQAEHHGDTDANPDCVVTANFAQELIRRCIAAGIILFSCGWVGGG